MWKEKYDLFLALLCFFNKIFHFFQKSILSLNKQNVKRLKNKHQQHNILVISLYIFIFILSTGRIFFLLLFACRFYFFFVWKVSLSHTVYVLTTVNNITNDTTEFLYTLEANVWIAYLKIYFWSFAFSYFS